MHTKIVLFYMLFFWVGHFSCKAPSTEVKTASGSLSDTLKTESDPESIPVATITVTARFTDFVFGDSEHYIFTDEDGRELDFAGNEDPDVSFSAELPEAEINEINQGWGANKDLQNKWFRLQYINRKQPLYPDGPEGDVNIIVKAEKIQ